MSIQINQIKGDVVELIFNPREEDLRVGQILTLMERTGQSQGLVVQIIEFRTVTYPALIQEQLQLAVETAQPLSSAAMEYLSKVAAEGSSEAMKNLKIAVAKIRNLIGQGWDLWDGWIPTRDVDINRTNDQEVFTHCVQNFGNRVTLGHTLQGVPFRIDGRNLEKVNIITGVKGSGKCVALGTLIPTHRGLMPIESLCPKWEFGWNRLSDPMWVQTPEGLREVGGFYAGGEQDTIRIHTRHGFSLEGTPEHPVWCRDRSGQSHWKTLGELTTDDYVAIQRHAPAFGAEDDLRRFRPTPPSRYNHTTCRPCLPQQLDEETGYLLGRLVGDGSAAYPAPSGRVDLTSGDPETHQAFEQWARRIGVSVSVARTKPVTRYLSNVVHREWLEFLGLPRVKSIDKAIPERILCASRPIVRAFLQGLFDMDGSAYSRGVEYSTSSFVLARQVHLLLLQFGIVARLRQHNRRCAWRVIMSGDNARKFFAEIGFRLPRKQKQQALFPAVGNTNVDIVPYFRAPISADMARALGSCRNYARGHATPSYVTLQRMAAVLPEAAEMLKEPPYFWDRIVKIERARAPVFDLHVPELHAFVANGIVSHNSHLSKVILLELINRGAPCIVFDINKEYIHLPPHRSDPLSRQIVERGIVHLKAGGNLKLSIRQFGLTPLTTMLTRYGLPEVSAMYFENRLARLLHEADAMERKGQAPPFIGIDQLIQMAEENEFGPSGDRSHSVVNGAIRSRLEALKNTGVFATRPDQAISFQEQYDAIRDGGALVVDISSMSNLARVGFVQAIIEMIKEICEQEIDRGTNRFPFLFFEEAHLYVYRHTIDYIVTRARHLGISSFFVTNMITGLDEAVLRQADNLFLLHLPFDDDVRHVGKSAFLDQESVAGFVRRLRHYHALVIGKATRMFPIIIRVDELKGINTAGETQYFFRSRPNQRRSSLPERSPSLPLAGDRGVSVEQVTQIWQQVVERVHQQRPLLGSFLAEGKLKEVRANEVRLTFSARQRLDAEMVKENRSLIEQELTRVLQTPMKLHVGGFSSADAS